MRNRKCTNNRWMEVGKRHKTKQKRIEEAFAQPYKIKEWEKKRSDRVGLTGGHGGVTIEGGAMVRRKEKEEGEEEEEEEEEEIKKQKEDGEKETWESEEWEVTWWPFPFLWQSSPNSTDKLILFPSQDPCLSPKFQRPSFFTFYVLSCLSWPNGLSLRAQ